MTMNRSARRLPALAAGLGLLFLLGAVGSLAWDLWAFPTPPQAPALPHAPASVPPEEVTRYAIAARYDPVRFQLTGTLTVTYRNLTSAPIPDVVLHLYLNAFKNETTLWLQEAGPGHRGFSYDPEHPGWIELQQSHLADGTPLTWEALDADATLVRAELPQKVAPGESFTLITDFTAQMPRVFARVGWAQDGKFLMAGQWFPKPGVWEAGAWNAYPFHANSEFYADFGTYDVRLTLPAGWQVVSNGEEAAPPQRNADGSVTHSLRARYVLDFVWAASPHLRTLERVYRPADSPAPLTLRYAYLPASLGTLKRVIPAVEKALAVYEADFGLYSQGLYPTLTVLLVPADAGGAGGMEYPGLFTVGALGQVPATCIHLIEVEAIHELAHQWWQSVVATNEAEEPWLDEGFTDYSSAHAMARLGLDVFDCGDWRFSYAAMQRLSYLMDVETPMAGRAWEFDPAAYEVATYSKPVVALVSLEHLVGPEAMRHFLQTYFARYAFGHPHAEDVQAVMAETLGPALAEKFFTDLVEGTGWTDAYVRRFDQEAIELARAGEVCFPLTVELVNGRRRQSLSWGCEQRELLITQPASPWRAVFIQPQNPLYLDLSYANNAARLGVDVGTGLSLAVRWIATLQQWPFWGGAAW